MELRGGKEERKGESDEAEGTGDLRAVIDHMRGNRPIWVFIDSKRLLQRKLVAQDVR